MNNNINEIIGKYTAGEKTLEETNEELAAAEAGFHLEPGKNVLTEEEKRATTIGYYPEQANGFGLLDTGTGSLDKVRCENGHLVNCDCGEMCAMYIIAGRTYQVKGTELVEPEPEQETPAIPARPDMSRRKDLAGKVVRQKTKTGVYDVNYDEDGYAVKAKRVTF